MTSQQILHADFLDILFEKRNKTYGAYQLRKLYPQQLAKAVLLAVSAVLLLLVFFTPSVEQETVRLVNEGVFVTTIDALPPEEKKPEPPKPPPAEATPVKQQTFIDNIILVEKDIQTTVPPIDELQYAAVSDKTTEGEMVRAMQPPIVPIVNNGQNAQAIIEEEPQKEMFPDKQPQFPGGVQAWTAFLNRYLQAPQELEPDEKRTVLIRFYVAEDGSVTNFQVLQSAGSVFDSEVIRVLKKMPAWTPATKSGRPVAVSFTQPVTFVGMEE
jgi:periplasmic protein TonB